MFTSPAVIALFALVASTADAKRHTLRDSRGGSIDQKGRRLYDTSTSGSGKSSKRSKGGKDTSAPPPPLVAVMGPVGEGASFGSVSVRYNSDGHFLVALDVNGIDEACTDDDACLVQIATEESCDGSDFTPYYSTDSDPWDLGVSFWSTNYDFTRSAFRVSNGYSADANRNHAIVLYNSAGDAMACGILKDVAGATLKANMGLYPGGPEDFESISGVVEVSFHVDGTFNFKYDLSNLEEGCTKCGIHIHSGTSCASHAEVEGHYWQSNLVQDLWTGAGGAFYNADSEGNAAGQYNSYNGYNLFANDQHAVVIHKQDGVRVGCGQLMAV